MKFDYTLEELYSQVKYSLENFDTVRIIDIETSISYSIEKSSEGEEGGFCLKAEGICFERFDSQNKCENCIASKCVEAGSLHTKFKRNGKHIYLIISKCIIVEGKKYAYEMICNITGIEHIGEEFDIFYQSIISRKNEELTTDHLTGIHNRKFIRERFVERITDYPNACMAVADVDFFKNINDRYGHWAGDKVLKSVARYWKKHFEDGNSFVARYGGDEFIFVCFDSSFEDFKKRVMDIYSNFRKTEILNNGKKVEFSMSIGCACLSELEEKTIERLFELADTRMYISKENRP